MHTCRKHFRASLAGHEKKVGEESRRRPVGPCGRDGYKHQATFRETSCDACEAAGKEV